MHQDKKVLNPWISITASDYEGHMNSPAVGQLKFLGDLLKNILTELRPGTLAVPGCATGNGFEHIDFNITTNVLAIDINNEYITILRNRFASNLDKIETVCSDLNDFDFGGRKFDLVHCALIFEYVDVPPLLSKIKNALNNNGQMTVLLQLPHEFPGAVSESEFKTLKKLEGFINLLMPEEFNEIAESTGFKGDSENIFTLESGKAFWFGSYKRNKWK